MRLNQEVTARTHEGAPAAVLTPSQRLRRSVCACLLWEDSFYEEGQDIAQRIMDLAAALPPAEVAALAVEVRHRLNIRHAPLLLLAVLAKTGAGTSLVSETVSAVIRRADEPGELIAVIAKINGVSPKEVKSKLSAQVKKGLAAAMRQFDAYQLGKYDRKDAAVRLRDVLRLSHPAPQNPSQDIWWAALVKETMQPPDTWEVRLSAGADKKETFERLLREHRLGYMALLRNLRLMTEVGVEPGLIEEAIIGRMGADRVLPFRFVAAARACPQFEPELDKAMQEGLKDLPHFLGKTSILVDVSGSMQDMLSKRSEMTRMDAAAALAMLFRGTAVKVLSFSDSLVEVPPRAGMAGIDAIRHSQSHSGTNLGEAVRMAVQLQPDRLIVLTDEQSHDAVVLPNGITGWMINVAAYRNGVGFGNWNRIDGFSENVFRYMAELETL